MTKINKKHRQKRMSLKERIEQNLEIPIEVLKDIPVIKISGNKEICIENFIKLIEYTPQKIRLTTKCGLLVIDGIALHARSMTAECMIIRGTILQVAFVV